MSVTRKLDGLAQNHEQWLRPRAWRGLLLLFLLSLVVRLYWWNRVPQVIESEGVSYARLGENIAAGRGYLGIREPGILLLYPPLYPALIACGVRTGLPSEAVGRLVSLLFGVAFPIVVCLLARRLYGRQAGWMSGLLAAVYPLSVVLSATVLTESAYLTLLTLAVYFTVGVLDLASRRDAILAGACLGLSYLCRPEAFIIAILFSTIIIAVNRTRLGSAVARTSLLLAVFSVLALPYMVFLTVQTGEIRYEAKTPDALAAALRQEEGQSWGQIYCGIDRNLTETGTCMISQLELVKSTKPPFRQLLRLGVRQARRNLPELRRLLGAAWLGQPFIGMLAALGCFAAAWSLDRLRRELPSMTICILTVPLLLTWPFFHDRFLFPILPPLLLWAGAGLEWLRRWTRESAASCGLGIRSACGTETFMIVLWLTLVCGIGAMGVRYSDDVSNSWSASLMDDIPVGKWLRPIVDRQTRIMDTRPTVAYYSGAVVVSYPWTDSDTALRYIAKKKVDYLILRSVDRKELPYLDQWNRCFPDERAELIKTFQGSRGIVQVYRWRHEVGDHQVVAS